MTAGAAAAAAARLRTPGTRALCWALKAPQPSLSVVGSNLPYRHFDDAFRSRRVTSATTTPPRPPPCSKPTDAAAIEDAERGLRILRERADALEQGGKQWHCYEQSPYFLALYIVDGSGEIVSGFCFSHKCLKVETAGDCHLSSALAQISNFRVPTRQTTAVLQKLVFFIPLRACLRACLSSLS